MRLAICNELFQGWSPARLFSRARALGYQGIEIAPFTLAESVERISRDERKRLRACAEEAGVAIVGTHWLLVSPEGLSVSSPEKETRMRTASYLASLVDFTADLGGSVMVFGSPKQRAIPDGDSRQAVEERLAEVLAPCLRRAMERSVSFCLEPLSRKETNFLNTADEAISFIRRVGHPHLRLALDVKAMCDEGRPLSDIISRSAEFVSHVHVNDPNLSYPGSGTVDFGPVISALRHSGYDGWLSVEVFDFRLDPETIARNSVVYLRRHL